MLLHGWGAGSGCFFRNVADMAPDRAILLIDLPGFGESDRTMLNEQDPESDWLASITSVISSELDQVSSLAYHMYDNPL